MKKVSIIIPVYNMEEYVKECFESIANQTYTNLEIIFVDDGSTDRSGELCDVFAQNDARVKVIHKQNGGVSNARNMGLEYASGEYIAFADPDDTMDIDMIQKLIDYIKKFDADAAFCRFHTDHIKDGSLQYFQAIEDKVGNADHALMQMLTKLAYGTMVWNKLFKKELIYSGNDFVHFDSSLKCGEDELWLFEVILKANKVVYIPDELYNWRIRRGSTYHKNDVSDIKVMDVVAQEKVLAVIDDKESLVYAKLMLNINKKIYQYLVNSYLQNKNEYYCIFYKYYKIYTPYWFKSDSVSLLAKIKRIIIVSSMKLKLNRKFVQMIFNL